MKNYYPLPQARKESYTSTYVSDALMCLNPGHHLCFLYSKDEDHRIVLTSFMRIGFERGEKVLYITDTSAEVTIRDYLMDDGIEVQSYLTSGQLAIQTSSETYLRAGVFNPDRMIEVLHDETERALSEGYTTLRVTGEITWAYKNGSYHEQLIEYESKLNTFFPVSFIV